MDNAALLTHLQLIAHRAGAKILQIYNQDFDVEVKGDGSAVTKADRDAEAIILHGLSELFPAIPVLAEEQASEGKIPTLGDRFFLVDPLDGTREFVSKNGEFTVNIALVENGAPTAGVVYAPAIGKMYAGALEHGASLIEQADVRDALDTSSAQSISVRQDNPTHRTAVASRSFRTPETEALLTSLNASDFTPAGSSLKFCLVAEGKADVYPRLGRTMEWDTGAGQAVLEAAGGAVLALDANNKETGPLTYGKAERGYDNPHFIAWGKRG